jgi:crotonobetainyl-CoA:carnitine CoA-transferase CaiB-like acyl-CoA transferase
MLLGDLGAEVIKIEEPKIGDPTRWSRPMMGKQSSVFRQINRNKKSIAIDLKNPMGRDLLLKLCTTADVILEQFRPGVVDRLGVGYSDVAKVNSRIVYCSLTGYGQDGPHRNRSGHDLNYLALSGVLGLSTDQNGRPFIPGVQIADLTGGMIAAFAIVAGLMARESTGRGQYVDVSMFDVMLTMLPIPAAQFFAGTKLQVGDKYLLSGEYPFYNIYETADGKYVTLGALEPKFWENFCRHIDREDLIARQFDAGDARRNLFEEVAGIFKSRTLDEWTEAMEDADCCCEPVLSLEEAFDHRQSVARKMVTDEPPHSLGFGAKFSDTPARLRSQSPELGEHTDELLAELGLREEERNALEEAGVTRSAGLDSS